MSTESYLVKKHPTTEVLTQRNCTVPQGTEHEYERMTIEEIKAWEAEQIENGWVPQPVVRAIEPPGPPEQVTKRQLLHWLEFDHGVADPEAAIVAAITAHVPEAQRAFALKDWMRTYYIRRDNQLVLLLAAALGIADVNTAFREMEEKYG